jgi:hypothetical protein
MRHVPALVQACACLIRHVQLGSWTGDGGLREAGRDGWLATDWLLQGAVPCKVGFASAGKHNNLREIALCLQQNCSSVVGLERAYRLLRKCVSTRC